MCVCVCDGQDAVRRAVLYDDISRIYDCNHFMVCCKPNLLTTHHEEYCKIRDQNASVESMKFAAFSMDCATFDK